ATQDERGAPPCERGTPEAAGNAARAAHAVQYAGQPARADRRRPASGAGDARSHDRLPARDAERFTHDDAQPAGRVRPAARLPGTDGHPHGAAPCVFAAAAARAGAASGARPAAAAPGGKQHPARPGAQGRWRASRRQRTPRRPAAGAGSGRYRRRTWRFGGRRQGLRHGAGARAARRFARRGSGRRLCGCARRRRAHDPSLALPAMTASNPSALIAEDEPLLARELQAELARAWPQLRIAATVGDGSSAVTQALALKPDVLFFDIRMPGQTGLEAAVELADEWPREAPFPALVFVTAYDQYAVQAFETQAVDYLLKPVQPVRLQKTVAKLQDVLARRAQGGSDFEATLGQLRNLLGSVAPPAAVTSREG